MRTTSELYKALLNDPDGLMEVKIVVNNDAAHPIYLDNISRLNIRGSVFGEDGCFSVGNAVSTIVDVVLTDIESAQIPRAAELTVSYRLSNGTDVSEWLPAGTLLVDHRNDDPIGNELTLECFDDMMKAEVEWVPAGMEEADWPMSEDDALQDIANQMGVAIDPRTAPMLTGYSVPLPSTGQTMRDTLRYIAASHMSNVIITPERKLRFVPLVSDSPGETINIDDVSNLDTSSPFSPVTGVTLVVDESATEGFVAGDDSGYMLTAVCPWASQSMADSCLQQVRGYVYTPMTLTDAMPDPTIELGDEMTTEGVEWPLCAIDFEYGKIWSADLSAPADQEVDHEYPYKNPVDRKIKKTSTIIANAISKGLMGASGGVVRIVDTDEDGKPDELYIADNPDPDQAQKVWRFNYEGWAGSVNGYEGPFVIGATFDDGIIVGGEGNKHGQITIYDSGGNVCGYINSAGVSMRGTTNPPMTPKLRTNLDSKGLKIFANGSGDGRIFGTIMELMGAVNENNIISSYFSLGRQEGNTGYETIYMDGKDGLISCKSLNIDGKALGPKNISSKFTSITTTASNHSVTMRYIPALGIVYFHLYVKLGDKAVSALTPFNIGTIGAGYRPARQEALMAYCGKIANATVQTDGTVRMLIQNAVSAGSNYTVYLTGMWSV